MATTIDRDRRPGLWRSRWAAIGAAVAVTLGGGGVFVARAASSTPSVFVAITPVRVLDTRTNAGLAGPFTSDQPRNLTITGTIPVVNADGAIVTGSPVPVGATAVVMNATAVFPTAAGFVSVRPGTATGNPTTSNINFTTAGTVVPNSVTVALPTSGSTAGQVNLFFHGAAPGSTTHLLLDVVGYYQQGPTGPPGPTGPTGPQGQPGLAAWTVIPSGTTVTGWVIWDLQSSGAGDYEFSVDLPAAAPQAIVEVNFAPDVDPQTIDDDPACTGNNSVPTAPPGKVCLYITNLGGATNIQGRTSGSTAGLTRAFTVYWQSLSAGDMFVGASWAYTAP